MDTIQQAATLDLATQMRIYHHGDTMVQESTPLPPPGLREIRVRHTAIGVNFVDVYHRTGLYPLPQLPATLGVEAAGVVEAVGSGVSEFTVGQRIAYAGPPTGSYATRRNLPVEKAIALPDNIADDAIAAVLLRGITAHMLYRYVWPLKAGDTVLVHAAAGGLGLVLTQWAKALGATVIGTVSTAAKGELAKAHGLDHAICYREQHFVEAALDLTGGRGVDYAIDGIGGQTLIDTFKAVRPYGTVTNIGLVSGRLIPPDFSQQGAIRSINFSRPSSFYFMRDAGRYREGAAATLAQLQAGLRTPIDAVLPLSEATEAHRRLETGQHTGAILLRP